MSLVPRSWRSGLLFLVARQMEVMGRIGHARALYRRALRDAPRRKFAIYIRYRLAIVDERIGNLEAAIRGYRRAYAADPRWFKPGLRLCQACLNGARSREAIETYAVIAQDRALTPEVHVGLAKAFLRAGEHEVAARAYAAALNADRFEPSSAFYLGLASANEGLGDWSAALRAYSEALRLEQATRAAHPRRPAWWQRLFRRLEGGVADPVGTTHRAAVRLRMRLAHAEYRGGRHARALGQVYALMTESLVRERGAMDLEPFRAVLLAFDHPAINREYVLSEIAGCKDDTLRALALALLAWMLSMPSVVSRILRDLACPPDCRILHARLDGGGAHGVDPERPVAKLYVVLEHGADVRVLHDCAHLADYLICMVPPRLMGAAQATLSDAPVPVNIVEMGGNCPVTTPEGWENAARLVEMAERVVREAGRLFEPTVLGSLIKRHAGALSLAFEDQSYGDAVFATSCAMLAKSSAPDMVYVVGGSSGQMPLLLEALQENCPGTPVHAVETPFRRVTAMVVGDSGHDVPQGPEPDIDEIATLLAGFLELNRAPLFDAGTSVVGVVANFRSDDFRVGPVVQRVIPELLGRSSCVALQRTVLRPAMRTAVERQLRALCSTDPSGELLSWTDLGGLFARVQSFTPRRWRAVLTERLVAAARACPGAEAAATERHSQGAAFVRRCVSRFVEEDLLRCLLLAVCAEETLSAGRVSALLSVGGDRWMFSRVFVTAARRAGVPSYSYDFLLRSESPRNKSPVSDYVITSDTFLAETFVRDFGVAPQRILLAGTHMVDTRRRDFAALGRREVRDHPDETYRLLFATQPLGDVSLKAVRAAIAACEGLDCTLVVKLHPTELVRGVCFQYDQLISEMGAADRVLIDAESDLTVALADADLVLTLFSNVGLEAAAIGKHVLSIQLGPQPFPVDLSEIGVALAARTEQELRALITDFQMGGPASIRCAKCREAFFARNPQLLSGSVEARIANFLLADMGACGVEA